MPEVRARRVYEPAEPSDGRRVLVDRLWPRGIARDRKFICLWARDIAPSDALRAWFHEDPEHRWPQFRQRYRRELRAHTVELEALRQRARKRPLTLRYAARDTARNHALILKQAIESG